MAFLKRAAIGLSIIEPVSVTSISGAGANTDHLHRAWASIFHLIKKSGFLFKKSNTPLIWYRFRAHKVSDCFYERHNLFIMLGQSLFQLSQLTAKLFVPGYRHS
jgi:hypothetical protein